LPADEAKAARTVALIAGMRDGSGVVREQVVESVQAVVLEQVNELYGSSGTSAPSRVNDVAVTVIACFVVSHRTLRFMDPSTR
jgi:hypothetical protein